MSSLTLALLGSPRIELDGKPVAVDTRKAIALVVYLAMTGEAHRRDSLATLLWPEYDQESARASLRRTLSTLKRGLGGEWLEVAREQIGLRHGPGLRLDVEHFRRLVAETRGHGHQLPEVCPACVAPLTSAAELYRGEFAAGFTLRDSPAFDDWQLFEAETLRREAAGIFERLARGLSAQGTPGRAIPYAQRWLALDPLHEAAHRLLMELYARAGERAAALRQYRDCVRVLERELGVAPLAETTELADAIKENRVPAQPSPTPAGPSAVAHSAASLLDRPAADPRRYPLVGRAAELAALHSAYACIGHDGRFAVVEGEAGVGKTRLAEECLARVRAGRGVVIAAGCHSGEMGLAYAPFVEGIRAALAQPDGAARLANVSEHWLAETTRLLPELVSLRQGLPPVQPLDGAAAQGRFFEGLSQVVQSLIGTTPTGVLFLDDVHWADEASLDLFAYLVRRLHGRPLLLLATWRSELVPPDHRLRGLAADAQRSNAATHVVLQRFSPADVSELVRQTSVAQGEQATQLAATLYQETEGLPFFLVEYLAAGGTGVRGTLPGVRDLLRSRLADTSQTGRQLLTTAAAIGRSFDLTTVREVSGRGEAETITALDELIARGLVREMGGAVSDGSAAAPPLVFDFTHERMRELVYEETTLVRRRLLHRRTAEVLRARSRATGESEALAAQVAHHFHLAGQDTAAAEHFRLAAEHARRVHANSEALAHFRSALALGHPDAAGAHEAIGDLQTLAGEYPVALTSYEVAAALTGAADLARLEHKLGNVYRRRGEWELAESHFEAARTALGSEGSLGERARLYADWSLVAHRRSRAAQAEDFAQEALRLAEDGDDPRARAQSHNILGILAGSRGKVDLARHHLERSLALAETLSDPSARISALNNLALAYGASDNLVQALEFAERALALCVSQGDRHHEAALHSNLADLLHAAGRPDAAIDHLKQAAPIFAEIGAHEGGLQPEIWKLTEW